MSIEQNDAKIIHCRMLGHEVPFSYCRKGASSVCCRKIFDCWFQIFDVEGFMKAYYTEEDIKNILSPQQPKITTLVELIRQAQETLKSPNQ